MMPTANWWEDFFTGLIVDFWRAAMPPEATRAEADFFERSLALEPGARLLDVPCGDGRLANPGLQALHGFFVALLDFSANCGEVVRVRLCPAGHGGQCSGSSGALKKGAAAGGRLLVSTLSVF